MLAAATGLDGYDARPDLDDEGWQTLLANLDRLAAHAAGRGLIATLHPHVGTMVERADEVDRVLDGSAIALCLDTGHLLVGGTDPAGAGPRGGRPGRARPPQGRRRRPGRAGCGAGELTYTDAVRAGMYRPLGAGDVDIAGIVARAGRAGYAGWYVLEQDTMLDAEPAARRGPVARRAAQRRLPRATVWHAAPATGRP